MAFLGFMTVREHEAVVEIMEAAISENRKRIDSLVSQKANHMGAIAGLQCEAKNLRAELATLKAERERRLAPLAAANAARKAKAQAARGGDLREGV